MRQIGIHDLPAFQASDLCLTRNRALASFYGQNEGVYSVSPSHMAANKPSNMDLNEINNDAEIILKPNDQPTDASYLLEMVRLADLSRAFIDSGPLSPSGVVDRTYEQVIAYDQLLQDFQNSLPQFYLVQSDGVKYAPLGEPGNQATIAIQRLSINCLVCFQRCILHLPYLKHDRIDEKFIYSRNASIESAEAIIQMRMGFNPAEWTWVTSRIKATVIPRSLILAGIVFILAICSSKTDVGDLAEVSPSLLDAWRAISELQYGPRLLGQLYRHSTKMLQDMGIPELTQKHLFAQLEMHLDTHNAAPTRTEDAISMPPDVNNMERESGQGAISWTHSDDVWQDLSAGFYAGLLDWESKLWEFFATS